MKAIHRLLLTDLASHWRQGGAIAALLTCGVALLVMMTSTMHSVEASRADYYREFRFADIFLHVTRAPDSIARRIAALSGVERVQTRVVEYAILDVPNMYEPVSCRIVSMDSDATQALNLVYLRRGRMPVASSRTEVVVSELFADAHRIQLGDELSVVLGGRREKLRVVGVGLSPEYVYVVQPGLLAADNRRFGVLWMLRQPLAAAFNMQGAFNDVAITLRPNASAQDVIYAVDEIMDPYGGRGAYTRKDQESNARLSDELHQMRSMAYVTPSIFLFVSAFLFNVVLSRLVNQQKEQIATMRAFGYRAREIGQHYLTFTYVFAMVGSVCGCLLGTRLSWWMLDIYVRYFRFPSMRFEFSMSEAVVAVVLAFLAATAGAATALRQAMRLAPAVAMRPEAPQHGSRLFLDRLGLGGWFSPLGRLILYRLRANPRTTWLSVLGVALGTAIVVLGSFMENTIDYVIDFAFQVTQRQDLTLTFREPLSERVLFDVAHLPGVVFAEPFRAVSVRLRNGNHQHRLALMGLKESPQLFRVLDKAKQDVSLHPQGGIAISKKLSEMLDVSIGQSVVVELLDTKRPAWSLPVAQIFPDYMSPGAYLNRYELHSFLLESPRINGVFLKVDRDRVPELFRQLKSLPHVSSVLDNHAAMKSFRALVAESTSIMRIINAVFASVIALGVLFNCALISLAERGRDLATLRVMGYMRHEVAFVLLGELAIITAMAIPIGLPVGYGFAYLTTLALDTESHRFPLVVARSTFAYAAVIILVATLISGWIVRRMLDRLDLIAVLKVKE